MVDSLSATLAIAFLLVAQPVLSGQLVEYLPGFDGKLPFRLETGYISVEESELFYYFIESEGNPAKDPLFLWLSGGPGCSCFRELAYRIGPVEFDLTNYDGGLPTLNYYPYSITKWLDQNPKYLLLETYIGGDSYAGIIVPQVTRSIVEGIEAQVQPHVNLKGYTLSSPVTDGFINRNARVIFAHRMGLISDEDYKAAKENCNENYVDVDPSNTGCVLALEQYEKCIKDLFMKEILEPNCMVARPQETSNQRSLQDTSNGFILSPPRVEDLWCRAFNYVLAVNFLNDPHVQDALHIRNDTISRWVDCNFTIDYTQDVQSVVDIHRYLTTKQLNVLIHSGDRDLVVPFVGTVQWIKSLNLTVEEDWRPWFVDGQVAGYTEKYYTSQIGYQLVYATVKGAGHTAPEYKRKRCYNMFDRWRHWYPL